MKKILKLITSAFLFGAIAFGVVQNGRNSVKVSAAPVKTESPAIKLNFIDNWGWSWYKLSFSNAVVDAGYSYNNWTQNPFTIANGFELPAYVQQITVTLDGKDGPFQPVTITSRGEWTLTGFAWQDPNRVITSVTRTGDYFSTYATTTGYNGGVDASRTRLWLDRGNYTGDDNIVVLNIADTLIEPSGYVEKHGGYFYAYYDVLISSIQGNNFKFHKLKNDKTAIWNTTTELTYNSGDSGYLFKVDPVDNGTGTSTLTKGAVNGTILNTFFAKVLEGYLTCAVDANNGYLAFNNIDANFLPRTGGNWDMAGDLGGINGVTINDYDGQGTAPYSSPRGANTVAVDAYEKYVALQAAYNVANPPARPAMPIEETNTTAMVALGAIGVVSVAGYFFISKKKVLI